MSLIVENREHLAEILRKATDFIGPIDIRALNRVLEYAPEDLTVTVEAGLTLADLQRKLAESGQWLPIDPPAAETITIWDLLKFNLSGPRRFGYGTIRDWLIGLKVALADGRLIKSGGKVVKNVAGYDLLKLFVGDHGSLGILVEATFKVQPRPEKEVFVRARLAGLKQAGEKIDAVIDSPLTPVVFDLDGLPDKTPELILGFAGTAREVEWLLAEAAKLGISEPAELDYEREFWTRNPKPQKLSVLPSRLMSAIESIQPKEFVCRAGNGVFYYTGGSAPERPPDTTAQLRERLKNTFDPKHILPELPS